MISQTTFLRRERESPCPFLADPVILEGHTHSEMGFPGQELLDTGMKLFTPPSSDSPPRKAHGSPDEWGKCMGPIGVEGILTVEERLPLKDL